MKAGLEKPGTSKKGLAGRLQIHPSQVSRMLIGKRKVQVEELSVIADYLGTEIPLAASVRDGTFNASTTSKRSASLGGSLSVQLVPVMAVIAPGAWREAGSGALAGRAAIPAVPDQRLAGLEQYACEIEGESGSYVVCVRYTDIRQRPFADDLVHVVRTKGDLREETLRRIVINGDTVRLQLPGDGAKNALAYPSRKAGEQVEIKGLVVGRFQMTLF